MNTILAHSPRFLFLLILFVPVLVVGQGSSPARGFQPGGSYALSDIETINTTNGNLVLNLALGKLAPGRGGLAGQLSLHYDSKLYDSKTQYYQDWEHLVMGEPQVVIRNMLVTSDQGGWHYGTGYELQLVDRMSQYPPEIAPQYPAQEPIYHYKVKVAFPDGSVHEFLPRGFGSVMEGYYDVRPDGWQTRFTGGYVQDVPCLTSTLTYYTFDGTYLRLEVQHDADGLWANNPWTLYFPDGTKVTNLGTRITDRNGNYVEWSNVTYNGHPATELMDQLGRKLVIEYQGVSDGEIIHVPGVGGADLTYQVHWKGIQTFKTYSTDDPGKYDASGYPDMLGYQFVVSRIDLPAATGGLQYVFGYNGADSGSSPCCTPSYGWGELNSVTLPSGAQAQYQYQLDGQNGPGFGYMWTDVLRNSVTRKSLTYQQQYDGSSTPVTETWNYDISSGMATIVMPEGGVVIQRGEPTFSTENADGTVSEKLWQANCPQGFPATYAPDPATGINAYDPQRANQYVKTEFTSIRDAGGTLTKTAIKDYVYDKNRNVTSVREYDWVDYGSVPRNAYGFPTGVPASAVLKRVTTNNYANSTPDASDASSNDADSYWNSTSPALKNAIVSSEVSNGSTTLTRAEFFYDNPSTTGNLTQQKNWDSAKGASSNLLTGSNSISTATQYDQYGNPTLTTDARGVQTRLVYGSVGGFTDLYPTQVQTAYQTAVQRTESREYDFTSGVVTRVTDVDNNVATATSYDAFGRPTLVKAAEGKTEETRTATEYSDVNRRVIVRSDLNTAGDEKLVSIQHYDQLGRVRLTRQLEDATTQSATDETTGIKVQTRYQYSGNFSYVLTSNPYRAATSASAGSETTMGWSRSKSDSGGRVIEVQTFGGATAPAPWGANTASTGTVLTAYDANFTTVTDQAGKIGRSMSDGLGRLSRVDEPDANGNLGLTSAPVQPTSYDYDALGNLVTVNQGGQTRSFGYSSLSRLTSATNPESGMINYQYDNNGNLTQKTDARNIVITYEYDALNRNTSVNYSNTTIGNPDVPDIKRLYDGATNGKGRFWYSYTAGNLTVGSNVEHTAIDSYDALGRPLLQRQLFKLNGSWRPTYQTSRAYNRAGGITTQTYPSGHTVTYNYDGAGRLADKDAQNLAFTGNLGDGVPRTYASGISYVSSGALQQEQFGTTTAVINKLFYNSRLQLAEIRTGTAASDWNRGKILNDYSLQCSGAGCNATDNNGNLRKQQLYIPGNDQVSTWTTWYQQYDYDSLNRLKRVHEYTGNTLLDWQQEYDYDRWGNRTLNATNTWIGNAGNPSNPALNEMVFETGNLAANNRLYAPGDLARPDNQRRMRYDAAGNLTVDSYTGAGERIYDAENRMTQAWANSQWQYYTYNADGQRTRRKINNQETWQLYGFDGELLAEYAANGAATSPQKEYGYRNGQLLVTAEATSNSNVALASSGATATGSSALSPYVAASVIDGSRRAINNTVWLDNTFNSFPDWIEISFNGSKTISEIDVITQQDDPQNPVEPTLSQTFSLYGITGFDVQYWNGSLWTTVPGGSVMGNNKVWRQFNFSPITTTKIRVVVNAGADNVFSRVVEVEAWGPDSAATLSNIHWLVSDQLGTPRLVLDQTGSLAKVTRHDYLPFGEELNIGLRAPSLGYSVGDGVRQQFTKKERDVETGLDYFGARYYASTQGRFTGVDPYDINLERQDTSDPEEANALFRNYISQPQHWNHYSYGLNNPLRYVDPDGLYEYETELLGQKIKVHVDDSIIRKDKDALNRIKDNLQKAFDKINSGAIKLTADQIESIHSQNRIHVSNDNPIGTVGGTFHITQQMSENPNIDKLAGDIIHDSRHSEQLARGLSYNEANAVTLEQEASRFTVDVMNNTGGWDADVFKAYQDDATTGHLPGGMKDKTTSKSRAKVLEVMSRPQKRRK